jgi:Co/Zn/Cd efflux system component
MAVIWSSRAAMLKGVVMIVFGVAVIGRTLSMLWAGTIPEAFTMGVIGVLALAVNVLVAVMLYTFREGNANMRSVWLCSRNDAIGNLAIVAAAFGVFGTGTAWPDLIVAAIMATLAITAGIAVVQQSRAELRAIQLNGGDNLMQPSRANPRH